MSRNPRHSSCWRHGTWERLCGYLEEFAVCGGVFIDAYAENDAALRRDRLLQAIERLASSTQGGTTMPKN